MAIASDFPISKENIEKYCDATIALRDNLEALQLYSEKYREFKSQFNSYYGQIDDLLHQISLENTTDSQKAILIDKLCEVKAEQAIIKDFMEVFTPIKEWYSIHHCELDSFKSVVDKIIKIREKQSKRHYVQRTNVIKETLGRESQIIKGRWWKIKTAKELEDTINFFIQTTEDYQNNTENESLHDYETQDILHKLELEDVSYHDTAKLGKALMKVRENRRKAKDSVELNAPLAEWIQSHSDVLKSLQKILGETRKIEDKQRRRMYVPRTKIVEEVIHW